MYSTSSKDDRGVNAFSPEGRPEKVVNAIEASKLGCTAIGIKTGEGVILACEKRVTSTLMEASSMETITKVDKHIGVTSSGLIGDSKPLVDKAQNEAANFFEKYGKKITVEGVTQAVSKFALEFGDDEARQAMSRPFGVALLFASCDKSGPRLFHMDPSGAVIECQAKAIGSGSEEAQQSLQEQYRADIKLQEAQKAVLGILKKVMKENFNSTNVEMATVTSYGYPLLTKEELEKLITAL